MTRAAVALLLAAAAALPAPPATAQHAAGAVPVVAAADTIALAGPATQGGLILGRVPAGTATLAIDGVAAALAEDGAFVWGIDRDAGPVARLVATLADGRSVTQTVAIAPRAWRIERLATLPRLPAPAPVFAALRAPELAAMVAARAQVTDAAGWRQRFVWPATGRLSGQFGAQRIYRGEPGAYHAGSDIAKPVGATVVAPADGVVILAAGHPFTLEGNLLMLDHGMGLNSAFLHLSRIDVRVGDHVRQGQPIGQVGMTGRATGPHLHWALRWHDAKLDPVLAAGPMPTAPQP